MQKVQFFVMLFTPIKFDYQKIIPILIQTINEPGVNNIMFFWKISSAGIWRISLVWLNKFLETEKYGSHVQDMGPHRWTWTPYYGQYMVRVST
jgi:hypothetical protein